MKGKVHKKIIPEYLGITMFRKLTSMLNISQYIHITNCYIVYLNLTQWHMSIISQ